MEQCGLKLQLLAGAGPRQGRLRKREAGTQDLVSGVAVSMAHTCPTSQGGTLGLSTVKAISKHGSLQTC